MTSCYSLSDSASEPGQDRILGASVTVGVQLQEIIERRAQCAAPALRWTVGRDRAG